MGHISTVEVRNAETDQMGIAHHSNYAIWFEVARTDFIKAAGISYTDVEKEGIITLIGFGFLMLLMVLVTWNDIQRFFF